MFNKEMYINRRTALMKSVNGGILILSGNTESPMNYPSNTYHFRQDSNFSYFTGLEIPNLALIMDLDNNTTILYGDDFEIDDIIWMGPQPSVGELALKCGITSTAPYQGFDAALKNANSVGKKIHFLPPYRAETKIQLNTLLNIPFELLKEKSSVDFIKAVVSLREIKSSVEIEQMEKACHTGFKMQTTAMKICKPGIYEREIAGAIEGIAIGDGGCVSFPVILSQHGETLHNHDHSQILEAGKLLLVDCGAENNQNYCSDYTRTIPVSGTYSPIQKQIYEIVLKANMDAIAAVKPGVKNIDIHLLACKVIAEGLKEAGLMKGDVDAAVKAGAHALFMPHGLGHMLGMDVHDMEGLGENYVGYNDSIKRSEQFGTAYVRLGKELKPGYVLTVEPGIYFIPTLIDIWKKEGKFTEFINYEKLEAFKTFGGIRIEDDVLVTETGGRVLGTPVPKTVAEIEKIMSL
ncbi:MAG: aminopeptidase P family protein [Bacteroidota bacterium]